MVSQASENFFTLKEVRQISGLTRHELEEQINKGSLRFRLVGREWVVTQNDLLEYLQASEIKPRWKNLGRGGVQIFFVDLVSNLRDLKRLSPGGVFGFSLVIHLAVLIILGFLVGLIAPPEVSRFVSFNLETTTAALDVEKPDNPKKARAVTIKEESKSSPVETKPPPQPVINESANLPLPEGLSLEKQLLPIKARNSKTNTFSDRPSLPKIAMPLEPVLIPKKQMAEVEVEQAAETTAEDRTTKKDSLVESAGGLVAAKQGPYRPGMGVAPPKLIYKIQPQYPKKAADAGIEGPVELEIVVKADGTVGDIRILDLPAEGLDFGKAAVEAVRLWKFLPGRFQGKPVDVVAVVAVNFRMEK